MCNRHVPPETPGLACPEPTSPGLYMPLYVGIVFSKKKRAVSGCSGESAPPRTATRLDVDHDAVDVVLL